MDKLYSLSFYSDTEDAFGPGFHIGLFATREDAERMARHYRREVPGFKDYDCDYSITPIPIFGDAENIGKVYCYLGWNVNDDLEEIDVLVSSCFLSRKQAEEAFQAAKQHVQRQEWVLNCYTVGQCNWAEGFERV